MLSGRTALVDRPLGNDAGNDLQRSIKRFYYSDDQVIDE